jgi:hypothetical protein
VESGEKLINKDEADDTCTRPHSGIKLYVINAVNEDNTEEENCDERNQTDNETTANDNEEASIGSGGFSVPSPDNCKSCIDSGIRDLMLIDSQSSSDFANEDGNDNNALGICGLNKNNNKLLIKVEAEDEEDNNKDDMKILLRVQGADERFDKYKKRFHLPTTLMGHLPEMQCNYMELDKLNWI